MIFTFLALFGILAFAVALPNPLLFDDQTILAENLWLRWSEIPNFYRSFVEDSGWRFIGYRPLLMTTFALQHEWFGLHPILLRLTNIFLHVTVAFFIYKIAKKIIEDKATAFLASCLFLLHPVQTNVIALIWKRSDLLVALGIFGSFFFFQKWAESDQTKIKSLFMGYLFALIAFFSKESALILPALLLLGDFTVWQSKKNARRRIFCLYGPLFILFLFHAWILFVRLPEALHAIHYRGESYNPSSLQLDQWTYSRTQVACFLEYLKLLLWPTGLNVYHDIPPVYSMLDSRFLIGIFLILFSLLYGWKIRKRQPVVSFLIFWFLITLAPASSFIPLELPFDEDRLYLPLFSFSLLSSMAIMYARRWAEKKQLALAKKSLMLFPILICVLYSAHDLLRLRTWRDPILLWSMNVRDHPDDLRPQMNLANALATAGQFEKAFELYENITKRDPNYALPNLYLASEWLERSNFEQAEKFLEKAFRLGAFRSDVLLTLGSLHARQHEAALAARHFSLSLAENQRNISALRNLALVLEQQGEIEGARRALAWALVEHPRDPQTQLRMAAFVWKHDQNSVVAKNLLQNVLKLRPNHPQAEKILRAINLSNDAQEHPKILH